MIKYEDQESFDTTWRQLEAEYRSACSWFEAVQDSGTPWEKAAARRRVALYRSNVDRWLAGTYAPTAAVWS